MSAPLSPAVARALAAHEAAPADRSQAHLADVPFRFEAPPPSAPPAPTPRPTADTPGADWTLEQALQELRIRGAEVVRSTGGLRVMHAHRRPALAAAVRAHAHAVGLWLDLGRPAPTHGWDDGVALRLAWLRARLGSAQAPVEVRPGVKVTDVGRFVAAAEGRYQEGPESLSADALRRDLADLYERYARPWSAPRRARVAARAA